MKIFGRTADGKIVPVMVNADGKVQVEIPSILAGNNLIGRVDARDGDKIFSFKGILEEEDINFSATAGSNFIHMSICPAGELWIVNTAVALNNTNTLTRVLIIASGVAGSLAIAQAFAVTATHNTMWSGQVILQEGDHMVYTYDGCTLNDDLYSRYAGYKMNI